MSAVMERDDVEPVANETLDRFLTGSFTVVPFLAVAAAAVLTWQQYLHWSDIVIFLVLYVLTGLGITVGFHRLLTHRAFKTKNWVKAMFAACLFAGVVLPTRAQDIEPRAYANAPVGVNFLIAGYAYTRGGLSFDSAVPLTNANLNTSNAVVAYAMSPRPRRMVPATISTDKTTARATAIAAVFPSSAACSWRGVVESRTDRG